MEPLPPAGEPAAVSVPVCASAPVREAAAPPFHLALPAVEEAAAPAAEAVPELAEADARVGVHPVPGIVLAAAAVPAAVEAARPVPVTVAPAVPEIVPVDVYKRQRWDRSLILPSIWLTVQIPPPISRISSTYRII